MRWGPLRHDEILRGAIGTHRGQVFATGGDGFAAVFHRSADAVGAAIEAQRALSIEPWPTGVELRVRMGLHSGEAEERDGDFFGTAVNCAARVMAVADGAQILVSEVTAALIGPWRDGRL